MSDLLENYLACWNETDPAARRALLEAHWAADATYTDPLADVAGHDALDATIAAVQAQFPGWVFAPGGPVDAHHQQARFTWTLGPAGRRTRRSPASTSSSPTRTAGSRPSSASSTASRPDPSPSHPVWSSLGSRNRPHRVRSGGAGRGAVQHLPEAEHRWFVGVGREVAWSSRSTSGNGGSRCSGSR